MGMIFRKLGGFLTGCTLFCILFLFPLLSSIFFVHGFHAISSNIGEVLSINPFANVFDCGDFNVSSRKWTVIGQSKTISKKKFSTKNLSSL